MLRHLILLILLTQIPSLTAQSTWLPAAEQKALPDSLRRLSRALTGGDNSAIQTYAKLLDDQRLTTRKHYFGRDTVAVSQLTWRSLFGSVYLSELSLDTPLSGAELRAYWQDNTRKIIYAPLLGRFTDVPPGTREVRYELQPAPEPLDKGELLEAFKNRIARAVANDDFFTPGKLIPKVGELGTPAAFEYLKEWAAGEHLGKAKSLGEHYLEVPLSTALAYFPNLEAAQMVIDLTRMRGRFGNGFVKSMDWITGVHRGGGWGADQDSLVEVYQELLDAYPSIPQLRELGFQQADAARPEDFDNRTAYLEYLITRPQQGAWVLRHALLELESRRDPRILVQLAALPLHNNSFTSRKLSLESWEMLQQLTNVRLLVENKEGKMVANDYNRTHSRNALHYWLNHYHEYKWSDERELFVYQGDEALQPLDTVAVMLERLRGDHDAVSVRAVAQLVHLPPDTLRPRLEDAFLGPLRGVNRAIPFALKATLMALAEVIDISRQLGHKTELPAQTEATLQRLAIAESPEERNSILSILPTPDIDDVIALEVWSYVHARHHVQAAAELNAWLMEWYANHWPTAGLDGENLRLFVLKSALQRTGRLGGLWHTFERVIEQTGPTALAALEGLRTDEDERIRNEAKGILARAQVQKMDSFTVGEYLEFSELGASVSVEQVTVERTPAALKSLFDRFEGCSDIDRYRLVALVAYHRDSLMTPYLLNLADDTSIISRGSVSRRTTDGRVTERFYIYLGDHMVAILEKLYGVRLDVATGQLTKDVIVETSVGDARLRDKWRQAGLWRKFLRE